MIQKFAVTIHNLYIKLYIIRQLRAKIYRQNVLILKNYYKKYSRKNST